MLSPFKSLKAAREDDKVKAIVMRINSPGGMALTSDIIWREIQVTKKVKPVIVIALWALIILLGYLTFDSVYGEIKFNQLK